MNEAGYMWAVLYLALVSLVSCLLPLSWEAACSHLYKKRGPQTNILFIRDVRTLETLYSMGVLIFCLFHYPFHKWVQLSP